MQDGRPRIKAHLCLPGCSLWSLFPFHHLTHHTASYRRAGTGRAELHRGLHKNERMSECMNGGLDNLLSPGLIFSTTKWEQESYLLR